MHLSILAGDMVYKPWALLSERIYTDCHIAESSRNTQEAKYMVLEMLIDNLDVLLWKVCSKINTSWVLFLHFMLHMRTARDEDWQHYFEVDVLEQLR